jgi:hypothetical protein
MKSIWRGIGVVSGALLAIATSVTAGVAGVNVNTSEAQASICVPSKTMAGRRIVDKQKLAGLLLKDAAFSVTAFGLLQNPAYANLGLRMQIVTSATANPKVCGAKSAGCNATDADTIGEIFDGVWGVLYGDGRYYQGPLGQKPVTNGPQRITPWMYFEDQSERTAVTCVGPVHAAPGASVTPAPSGTTPTAEAAEPPATSIFDPLRIRGTTDDLLIDRGQQTFKGSSKATINFNGDGVARTRTDTMTIVMGYAFGNPSTIEAVPYVATNRKIVNVNAGSTSKPSSADTANTGVAATGYFNTYAAGRVIGNRIVLRPDFLEDMQDNSQIDSLQFRYIPEVDRDITLAPVWLNTFAPLVPGDPDPIWVEPMLDFRLDNGIYTNRGLATVAKSHVDYVRLGGQAGLSIILPSYFPVTLTTSYIGLYGARGNIDIGYFANSLSYPLVKDYVAITASYTNGNREDTAKREQLWLVGLSLHY